MGMAVAVGGQVNKGRAVAAGEAGPTWAWL